jgi:transposase InsO family protein
MRSTLSPYLVTRRRQNQAGKPANAEFVICDQSIDITYLWTDEGWLYLAIVLDLFNREVVGWSLKPRMTADLAVDALTMAWFRRRPGPGATLHSDRGSQYGSSAFQGKLAAYGMTCSISRKGNCWNNAPTESWFNNFKNEHVYGVRHAPPRRHESLELRVHRSLLQSQAATLHAWLFVPSTVHGASEATAGKAGSMNH